MVAENSCKKKILNVPYDLLHHSWHNNLTRALQVYLYFNCYTDGIFNQHDDSFQEAHKILKKDRRTIDKYIDKLIEIGWLGYCDSQKRYYLSSMRSICSRLQSNNHFACKFLAERDLRKISCYTPAVLISYRIKRHKDYWKGNDPTQRSKKLANQKVIFATQANCSTSKPEYFGLGLRGISEILQCSEKTACKWKHKAERAGYLKTTARDREITKIRDKEFIDLKRMSEDWHKLRIRPTRIYGELVYVVLQQLHDQIEYYIQFRRLKKN